MRSLGFALDEASLQQIAYANGIEQTYSTMTQAEKAQLRYIALMTQIPQVQGDMSRTLSSAANSLRVLQQQFTLLGREIGNIFIPSLNAIIPIAIAVVKVLGKIAKAIASLFGFTLPDLNWDGVQQTTGTVASDLEDANGSATKLKRQLAGFDELNNLTTPSSGGSGTGASPVGGGFDIPLPEYDMLEGLDKGIEDLTSQVMEFFGLTEDASGKLSWSFEDMDTKAKALMITLGTLAGAKILGKLGSSISTITTLFKTLGSGVLNVASPIFSLLSGGTTLTSMFKDLKYVITGSSKGINTFSILVSGVLKPLAKFATGITGIIAGIKGISNISNSFKKIVDGTMDMEQATTEANKGVLELTASGVLLGSRFGIVGGIIGGMVGALTAGITANIAYKKSLDAIATNELYGNLKLTEQQLSDIGNTIVGTLNKEKEAYDSYKSSLSSGIEELEKVTSSFDSLIYKYQVLGEEITGVKPEEILQSLTETADTAQRIISDSTDETLKLFETQFAEYTTLSKEEQKDIIKNIQSSGDTKNKRISEIEDEVTKIYENAIAERGYLNDSEIEAIKNHYDEIVKLTTSNLESSGLELNRILANVQSGTISLSEEGSKQLNETLQKYSDEALGIIDENYNARLDSAKIYAQTAYDNAILAGEGEIEAQKRYNEAMNRLEDDANSYKENATGELNNKVQEINNAFYGNAIEEYKKYYGKSEGELDDYGKVVKKKYEEMLTNAGYNLDEIGKKTEQTSVLATQKWNDNFKPITEIGLPKYNLNEWSGLGNKLGNSISDGIQSVLRNTSITTSWNSPGGNVNFINSQLGLRGFASGGYPDTGEFFMARESGPEMVGRIGNRTAVANNDQIVEAIERGVYRATVNANSGGSGTNYFNVNVGNRKVYSGMAQSVKNENNRYGKSVIEV